MKIKRSWVASGIIVASVLLAFSNNGCGDDDDDDDISKRTGKKGEACQSSRDCAPGLACIPRTISTTSSGGGTSSLLTGGTCVVGVFNVAPTNKECARTACDTFQDCCKLSTDPSTTAYCESQKATCEGPGATDPLCTSYRQLCTCDPNRIACEAGECSLKCVDDGDCATTSGFPNKCVGGKCAQCSTDTDCKAFGDDQTCVNAKCQPPCKGDGDCDDFDRCLEGKCVAGGCQSSRECIAATRNVEATCGTDGKCIVPCQTDLECGNPTGYRFFSCIANQCVYTGCDSDKDCRIYFEGLNSGVSSSSGGASDTRHYVCREKGLPGNIVLTP